MESENDHIRSMEVSVGGDVLYKSSFDQKTGRLVRIVEDNITDDYSFALRSRGQEHLMTGINDREHLRSPVPETVDLKITDKCPHGCDYCYMDSLPDSPHAPADFPIKVIEGFDQPPYQMALGGGEPTIHPDFPEMLKNIREKGVVPTYTTSGTRLYDEVVDATNEYCGGVAVTYHPHKGFDWFEDRYAEIKEKLDVQLNVHVLADGDVIENLEDVLQLQRRYHDKYDDPLSVVLLAYYPDVGRAKDQNWVNRVMSKEVYQEKLPKMISRLHRNKVDLAFSEGLMPYVMSRPELPLHHNYLMASEGYYSCYFDMDGQIYKSSFDHEKGRFSRDSIDEKSPQELWNGMSRWFRPRGGACYKCEKSQFCVTPHATHYNICDYAPHNDKEPPREGRLI